MTPNINITRVTLIAGTLLMAASITSCDNDTLTPRLATKALEKEAMFADSSCVKNFKTGFYEVTPIELAKLQQLDKAGMIDLKTSSAIEKKEVSNYSYWSGYTTASQDVEHTFASVTLTDEAKKYIVHHTVRFRDDHEKDMGLNAENKEEAIPDYALSNNDLNTGADIEDIVKETAETEEMIAENTDSTEEKTASQLPSPKKTATDRDYKSALAKVNVQSYNMLLGKFELVKVKEVFCPEDLKESGIANCSYIYRFINKTPFGYVLGAPENEKLTLGHASFRRYVDMGWIVDSAK